MSKLNQQKSPARNVQNIQQQNQFNQPISSKYPAKEACKNSPAIYPKWPQERSHNSNKIAPTMKQNDQQYITQIMVKTSLDFMQNQQEKWSSKIIALNWSNKAQESNSALLQCQTNAPKTVQKQHKFTSKVAPKVSEFCL